MQWQECSQVDQRLENPFDWSLLRQVGDIVGTGVWSRPRGNLQASENIGRPERVFAAFGRESLAALGTVAAARRRPAARCARLVEPC